MEQEVDIDAIRDHIVFTEKVAHVTFYLVRDELPIELPDGKWDDGYLVYSTSDGRTLAPIDDRFSLPSPHDEAMGALRDAAQKLENIIEKRRKGMPTARQLHFLFREKIPISLDLTWGEASDIIDERLREIKREKEAKRQAKEAEQRAKKERQIAAEAAADQWYNSLPFHSGDKVKHPLFGPGIVLHAGDSIAGVQFRDEKRLVKLEELE